MHKLTQIILIGPTGAGKTTVGQWLAKKLNRVFYDSDQEIVKQAKADIPHIFKEEGEQGFRYREEQAIAKLLALPNIILATGGGAVLSARNRVLIANHGKVVYLKVSLEQQIARLQHQHDRPLLFNNPNRQETLAKMQTQREPLYNQLANLIVSTDGESVEIIIETIINKLGLIHSISQ